MEDAKRACYLEFYRAKIAKDRSALESLLDNSFVLVHMTGMRQDKRQFIRAVADGTLNYYSAHHDSIRIEERGSAVTLVGQTCVLATVFGGEKHTWRLQLQMELLERNGKWLVGKTTASTY